MSASGQSPAINVRRGDGDVYLVTVAAARPSEHRVTVTADHLRTYAPAGVEAVQLMEASFRFLLEREPNTSILARFELPVIERYFPEYREEIRRRLS